MERLNPIAVLVKNEPGVLARVAGLFTRRGSNIISLAVGETEYPAVSRMSVVVSGDDAVREQVIKQLRRLVDVHRVDDLTYQPRVERGLTLIKVKAPPEKRGEIVELANIFRAAVIHVDPRTMVVEVSSNSNKIDAMLDMMRPFGILEMARTGQIVMARGRRALPGQEQMQGQTPDHFYETDHDPLGFDDPDGNDQTNLLRLK